MAWHPDDFPLLDDYNRANTGPPAGPIWSGLTFWGDSSGLLVTGNQMATSGSGYRCDYTTLSYPRSASVGHRFAIPTAASGVFIAWLLTDPSGPDGYGIRYDGTGSNELLKYTGGSATWLGGWSQSWVNGDELCLIANDDGTLSAWHYSSGSWVKKVEVTDTTYTGSFHIGYTINSDAFRVDNTFGGNPVGVSLDEITDADFESFSVGSNPSGVAPSGTTWHRTNANRTVVVDNNRNPRRGTRSCWIERQVGDVTASGNRTEFYDGRSVLENSSTGHDAYYATSIYLPNGTESHLGRSDPAWDPEDNFALVWQIHQQDDIPGSPPIGLHADRYWSAGNDVSLYLHIRGGDPNSPSTQDLFFTWDEEIRGQWLDVIFRIKFATDSTGLVQGWIRREAESDFTACHDGQPGYIYGTWTNIPTAFTGDTASYRKGGIYLGVDKRQTIYHHGYGRFLTYEAAEAWFSSPIGGLRSRSLLGVGS